MITIDPPSHSSSARPAAVRRGLAHFLRRACGAIGIEAEVAVLLTGDEEIRRLNRSFRGKNKATDVLSFPAPAELCKLSAGDLAISLETAARQAEQFGHTLQVELRVLMLHGLLHLAGYDHEVDRGEMAAEELRLRRELRLPVSLIARTIALPDAGEIVRRSPHPEVRSTSRVRP